LATLHLIREQHGAHSKGQPSRIVFLLISQIYPSESFLMTAPEPGPNRMNMKFTNGRRTVVIHLVPGLPPKLSRDKKTITITFAERATIRKAHKG
jgi:hypothetical protein